MNTGNWDRKGPPEKRFRWSKFKFQWGRRCYNTDCNGNTIRTGWEWDETLAIEEAIDMMVAVVTVKRKHAGRARILLTAKDTNKMRDILRRLGEIT